MEEKNEERSQLSLEGQELEIVTHASAKGVEDLLKVAAVAKPVVDQMLLDICRRVTGGSPVVRWQVVSLDKSVEEGSTLAEELIWPEAASRMVITFKAGLTLTLVRLKGRDRMVEKSIDKYAGRCGKILDVVRASISVDSEALLVPVWKALGKATNITRCKNLFSHLDPVHFRRIMLNLCTNVAGHVVEVQLHHSSIFKFKQENNEMMHAPYEYFRSRFGGTYDSMVKEWQTMKEKMAVLHHANQVPVLLSLLVVILSQSPERVVLPESLYWPVPQSAQLGCPI